MMYDVLGTIQLPVLGLIRRALDNHDRSTETRDAIKKAITQAEEQMKELLNQA